MKISHSSGLVDWQSASLPGRPPPPSSPLRLRASSRALRAAIRAVAAAIDLRMMSRPSPGFFSNHWPSWSLTTFWTNVFASVLPSLVFVWPSNCGFVSLIETIAVRPSRTSSPGEPVLRFLTSPHSSAQLLTVVVSAARKPSSWVPPSWVLIVLANVCTDSV